MSGSTTIGLDMAGVDDTITVVLGGTTPSGTPTQGMIVRNGQLVSLNMAVESNFSIGSLTLSNINFVMAYQAASDSFGVYHPSEFTLGGTASLNLFNVITLDIDLGQNGQPGLVIENGTLEYLNFSVDTSISFLGFLTAYLDISATYSASTGVIDFEGTAGLELNWNALPWWMHPFWGGTLSLGTLGFELYVDTHNENNSFVDFWASIIGIQIGVQIGFNGSVNLSFGDPREVMAFDPNATWDQTAEALAQAYQAASNGVGAGYNITPGELDAYGSVAVAQAAASAIAQGQEDNWDYRASLGDLDGALAFYDPTGTGVYEPGDPTTTTAPGGGFNLSIPAGSTGGEIVVTGGTDLSTGLPNQLVLTAPLGATQVNPFTTLLDDVMQIDPSLTESDAVSEIDQALGLPALFDFTQEDYLDGALIGSVFDATAFAEDAKIVATANMVVTMLGGLPGAPRGRSLGSDFFNSLASAIDQGGGTSPVDLSDATRGPGAAPGDVRPPPGSSCLARPIGSMWPGRPRSWPPSTRRSTPSPWPGPSPT